MPFVAINCTTLTETILESELLRVLQEKEIRPVGSDTIIPVDVRVIAATNKNLHEEVKKDNFRLDLYYRLNVLRLDIMPLRKRPEDIYCLSESIMYKKNFKNTFLKCPHFP